MCSLTWLRRADGYELFFNRDESRRRLPAHPPQLRQRRGVPFLAPLDADAGGTWLAANAHGLSVALLNGPAPEREPCEPISRGELVIEMADASGTEVVAERLRLPDLARFRPFQLVALEPGRRLLQARWDGLRLALELLEDDARPLSSSSLDPLGAGRSRRELLLRMEAEAGELDERLLLGFHASHEPTAGALSPCMHRDDAETVSFTRVRVSAALVELGYSPAAPCRGLAPIWLGLERSGASAGDRSARGSAAPPGTPP